MDAPHVTEIRPFLPTKDLPHSRNFYLALGWALTWEDEQLALLTLGDFSFYLQNSGDEAVIGEHMLFLQVENVHAWREHVESVLSSGKFPEARLHAAKQERYGAWVMQVEDPAGVLLHFAQPSDSEEPGNESAI